MPATHAIQLPVFEGPLDLLLHLIEREELDITTIALAQVTDQYMAYLAALERQATRELADFLVVAAKLVLIKSNALLPKPPAPPDEEPEDVGQELVDQLRAYRRFKQAAAILRERQAQGMHSYIRIASLPRPDPHLDMGDVTLDDLITVAQEVLGRTPLEDVEEPTQPILTVEEQIDLIERRLVRNASVTFRTLLSQAARRLEVIITLLAVLQMIKQGRIVVRQRELFGEILIQHYDGPPPGDAPATNGAA
jgi:segregation and condensation protein A